MPDITHVDPDVVLDQIVNLFWERGAESVGSARSSADFFHRQIEARCTGEHARWGCVRSCVEVRRAARTAE